MNLSPVDSWSADGVEGHVPRTLALGGIVPILGQERQGGTASSVAMQGWTSPLSGNVPSVPGSRPRIPG
jgi:hypothetical protein